MEQEKFTIFTAAEVARRCKRGQKLNYPEDVAITSAELLEGTRDGRGVTVHDPIV